MSQYTSLGVTVSPLIADGFVRMLEGLDETPDKLARMDNGSVTAIWEYRNHFNAYASDSYRAIMDFLRQIPEDLYQYESITEDYEPEEGGTYGLNFYTYTVYEVFGEPFRLGKKTVSKSRKPRRRRYWSLISLI